MKKGLNPAPARRSGVKISWLAKIDKVISDPLARGTYESWVIFRHRDNPKLKFEIPTIYLPSFEDRVKLLGCIDRIEDGRIGVLEFEDFVLDLHREYLPLLAKEGDWFRMTIEVEPIEEEHEDYYRFTIELLPEYTEKKRREIKRLQRKLLKRSRG